MSTSRAAAPTSSRSPTSSGSTPDHPGTGPSLLPQHRQVCLGLEHVSTDESIFDQGAERLVEFAEKELRYAYPDADATNFGPVVSDEPRDKVLSYYKLAEEEGATVL